MKGNIIYTDAGYRMILGNFNANSATGMLQKEGFVFDQYSFTSSKDFHDFTSSSPSSNDYSGYTGASLYYTFSDTRLSVFAGRKYLSGTLNGDGELESVNLYAYTRTLTETERYHNAAHDLAGAGLEGSGLGIRYAASVTNERFDREIAPSADLMEGTTGELSLQKSAGEWIVKAETASDFEKFNLKLNARMRSKGLTTGFFYGYVQQDKFCLSSPGMFFGGGEEEHVFGMKFNIRLTPELIVVSENLIFSTVSGGTSYPGSKFSLKTVIRRENISVEPYFSYKYSESSDTDFFFSSEEEYQAKLKIKYTAGPVTSSSYISYTDSDGGTYGYIAGTNITSGKGKLRIRTGGDIYQTWKGQRVYSAISDIGRYASLTSFSGIGSRSYLMIMYISGRFEISAGVSRMSSEDEETSGSGYDLIDSDSVHDAEINIKINI